MPVYVGVDLGGTTVGAAAADDTGRILRESSIATESAGGPEHVLSRIASVAREVAGGSPAAVGVGIPGLADLAHGRTLFLPNLPTNWRDVPVAERVGAELGCPVYLLNDARLAAFGELVFGAGKTVCDLVFFTLGTGIGGGVVIDGKLRLGPFGAAGELGHQTIVPDGPRCGCGNCGCLEALASAPALVGEGARLVRSGNAPRLHELIEGNLDRLTPREMAAAARAGDHSVAFAIERAARWLGIGVANVITALHPELVVLGGGMAALGDLLFDPVRDEVRRRVRMFPADSVRIEPSQLGDKAGILGGVALARSGGRPERMG